MAPSAVEALRILDGSAQRCRSMVTDLNMPRMDGYRVDPAGAGGPATLRYAYHRSERRYRPDDSAADCGIGSGSVFPETVFAGAGAPETGATSRWQYAGQYAIVSFAWRCCLAPATSGRANRHRTWPKSWSGWTGWNRKIALLPNRCARCSAQLGTSAAAAAATVDQRTRDPTAAHRRAGADQGGVIAEVSHPPGRNGAVQRVRELQAERRRGLPGSGRAHRPGTRRRHRATDHHGPGIRRSADDLGRQSTRLGVHGFLRRGDEFRDAHAHRLHRDRLEDAAASWPVWRSRSSIRANRVRWRRWAFPR